MSRKTDFFLMFFKIISHIFYLFHIFLSIYNQKTKVYIIGSTLVFLSRGVILAFSALAALTRAGVFPRGARGPEAERALTKRAELPLRIFLFLEFS